MPQRPKFYTTQQANKLIPKLVRILPKLRKLRDLIIMTQDQSDVEEITSHGSTGRLAKEARRKIENCRAKLKKYETELEAEVLLLEKMGCELKSLEPGLVDFYSKRKGQVIYLCWQEGESEIRFWHSLNGGFSTRHRLD